MELRINTRGINTTVVFSGPTVLIGPNGSGKSTIMKMLYNAVALANGLKYEVPRNSYIEVFNENGLAVIEAKNGRALIEVKTPYITRKAEVERVGEGVTELLPLFATPVVATLDMVPVDVDGNVTYVPPIEALAMSPELAERVESAASAILEKVERLRISKNGTIAVKVEGKWVPFDELSSGYRKAIERIIVFEAAELMRESGRFAVSLVEDFDESLYYDVAVAIVDYISKLKHLAVVEARNLIVVRAAMSRGLTVYYVKNGEATRIDKERLRDTKLFEAEYRALEIANQA